MIETRNFVILKYKSDEVSYAMWNYHSHEYEKVGSLWDADQMTPDGAAEMIRKYPNVFEAIPIEVTITIRTIHDTAEEAAKYLDETYPEDEDE